MTETTNNGHAPYNSSPRSNKSMVWILVGLILVFVFIIVSPNISVTPVTPMIQVQPTADIYSSRPIPSVRAPAVPGTTLSTPVVAKNDPVSGQIIPTSNPAAPLVSTDQNGVQYLTDHNPPPAGFAPTAMPLDPAALPENAPQPASKQCVHGQVYVDNIGCRNPMNQSVSTDASTGSGEGTRTSTHRMP